MNSGFSPFSSFPFSASSSSPVSPFLPAPSCAEADPAADPARCPAAEGRRREQLAAYFLSLPAGAPDCLDKHGRALYRRMARRLTALEQAAVLQAAGRKRVLRYGDAAGLLKVFARAAEERLSRRGKALSAAIPDSSLLLALEPRLLLLAAGCLLRDAAAAGEAALRLFPRLYGVQVAISGATGFCTKPTRELVREVARLHRGTAVFSTDAAAFSLHGFAGQADGFFAPPTAEEMWQSPLSPANLALF